MDNQWIEAEKLVYLCGSLDKEAGQVLWDYSAETTNSLKEMVKVLKERFGEANQADKYRIEVKNRKWQPGETLRNLHSDIRRLVALVLPGLDRKARETLACDYFKRLQEFLDSNNLMPVKQSAYRQYHSTETAVTKVYNDVLLAADEGDVSALCSVLT